MTWALANWKLLAIGVLVALLGLQQVRVSNAKAETAQARTELASDRATYAQAAQAAEQTARAEESRREAEKEENANDARKKIAAAQADATRARAAAVGLRSDLAAYVAAVSAVTKDSIPPGGGTSARTSLDLLAQLLSKSDDRAGIYAEFADHSRIAGLACERAYRGLRAPQGQAAP